jgi:hypothetical protein
MKENIQRIEGKKQGRTDNLGEPRREICVLMAPPWSEAGTGKV